MKHNNAPRARKKLFIFFIVYALAFLAIISLCQTLFLEPLYKSVKKSEIKNVAKSIEKNYFSTEEMSETAKNLSAKSEICVIGYRMSKDSKEQIFSYDVSRSCIIHKMSSQIILDIYSETINSGGTLTSSYKFSRIGDKPPDFAENDDLNSNTEKNDTESIIYASVFDDGDGNNIFIILNVVLTPLRSTVRTMNFILLIVGGIMVATAIIMAFFISHAIVKPINVICSSAIELAHGNYQTEFMQGSYREINELSDTLNYAANELGKVDSLKRELIANTSHDLRTPLTMISGYAEVMRDIPGENTPENAQVIIDETARLTSLVNDMLDISKLEGNTVDIVFSEICVTDAISDTLNRYNHFKTADGFIINFFFERKVIVNTDKSKYLQAFCNLMNNALTYTGEDKTVNVQQIIYTDEFGTQWVRVSVSDSGEGIPPDKLSLIWDRYYKLDSNHKRSVSGSGLGLSIVNKIMSAIGGRCDVYSEVGKGSTFSIEIPFIRTED